MRWQLFFDRISTEGDTKEKVERKFSGLETYIGRFAQKVQTGFVRLSRGDRRGYKVSVDLHLPGKEVVAEGRNDSLLSAIDEAYARAAREIKGYVDRLKSRRKNH